MQWNVIIEHCYRETNKAADHLANLGAEQQDPLIFLDHPPISVKSILLEIFLIYFNPALGVITNKRF